MSPFAGEGANLALHDGALLAEAIVANPANVEAALEAYEKALFPRSAETAAETNRNLRFFFNDNAPYSLIELFSRYQASS
jgi:2-polyprenyl-6-methoxyphenol hydroxylase-like FAD-dependent oxidoreductase